MAAKKSPTRKAPGPAPALGKRTHVTVRTPDTTIDAYNRESLRREISRSELFLKAFLEYEKTFASAE